MDEERLTAIIGIRIYPSWKKELMEDAMERGQTLSEYILQLIRVGWEQINKTINPQKLGFPGKGPPRCESIVHLPGPLFLWS